MAQELEQEAKKSASDNSKDNAAEQAQGASNALSQEANAMPARSGESGGGVKSAVESLAESANQGAIKQAVEALSEANGKGAGAKALADSISPTSIKSVAGALSDANGKSGGALKDSLADTVKGVAGAENKLNEIMSPEKIRELTENFDKNIHRFDSNKMYDKSEGSHNLNTGDRLVVKDGKETLVTPNGDVITVGKDGTVKVEGDVKSVKVESDGSQSYTMSDGAVVRIGKDGIQSVDRNGSRASLLSPNVFGPLKPIKDWPTINKPLPIPDPFGPIKMNWKGNLD